MVIYALRPIIHRLLNVWTVFFTEAITKVNLILKIRIRLNFKLNYTLNPFDFLAARKSAIF